MPNYYDIGDVVRTSSTFTDTGGSKADPTSVTWVLTTPDRADTVKTMTSTSTLENTIHRTTAGVYFRDVVTTASGPYWYRYSSTGNITTAAENSFRVRSRRTTT